MNVADYQAKVYADPPCWKLVADVYMTELGMTVTEYQTVSTDVREIAAVFDLELRKGAHGFRQIAEPVDFAVVLMGKSETIGIHHAGVYYAGSVLHARPDGVFYQDMFSLRDEYQLMKFWTK